MVTLYFDIVWKVMAKPLSVTGANLLPMFLYSQSQHHCSRLADLWR